MCLLCYNVIFTTVALQLLELHEYVCMGVQYICLSSNSMLVFLFVVNVKFPDVKVYTQSTYYLFFSTLIWWACCGRLEK